MSFPFAGIAALEAAGFDKKLVLYSYVYGIAKPSEKLFGVAVARIAASGGSAETTLFIGDSPAQDILPARQAGFKTILCSFGPRPPGDREGEAQPPDAVVTEWEQLRNILA